VEIHAERAKLGERFDDTDWGKGWSHGVAERIASDVPDGPQSEGEVVLGAGRIGGVVGRHRSMEVVYMVTH